MRGHIASPFFLGFREAWFVSSGYGNWDVKLEALFLAFATSDKCYSYDIVLDLLLLIGKTLSRQQWLPKDIQKQLSRGISEALTQLEPQMPETFYLEVPRRFLLDQRMEKSMNTLQVYSQVSLLKFMML
ncbi:hypothetical protein MRB53_036202 [Persea americana]|uniref:Uncharacterized protein n=1 Tax=Persea americana TaxID=3435 RepID=A0ACC2K6V7_PERAE|nr:hypothetical protein MRB53_036202 [Persea americana]